MVDWTNLTPCVERTWKRLNRSDLEDIATIDRERLRSEREGMSRAEAERVVEPVFSVRNQFRRWERTITRMESGWPRGSYPPEEYANDLAIRDGIAEDIASVGDALAEKLDILIDDLDSRYAAVTTFDAGREIGHWTRLPDDEVRNWWWNRRPIEIPWE